MSGDDTLRNRSAQLSTGDGRHVNFGVSKPTSGKTSESDGDDRPVTEES
jgi:hypothetical protein